MVHPFLYAGFSQKLLAPPSLPLLMEREARQENKNHLLYQQIKLIIISSKPLRGNGFINQHPLIKKQRGSNLIAYVLYTITSNAGFGKKNIRYSLTTHFQGRF